MALTRTTELLVDLIIDSVSLEKTMPKIEDIFSTTGTSSDLTDTEAAVVAAIFMSAKSGKDMDEVKMAKSLNLDFKDYKNARESAFGKIEQRVRRLSLRS